MGAEQSAVAHNPLNDGWESTYPLQGVPRTPPPRKVNPPYQPSFLTEHVKSLQQQQQRDPPAGAQLYTQARSAGPGVGESYMLAHAKRATSALPIQSARVNYYHTSKTHTYGSQTYLAGIQKKAQEYMSPVKSAEDDHASHVAVDDLYISQALKATKGMSNVTGITSEWNKFSSERGLGAHQELDEAWTQAALKVKKHTANVGVSPHVGVPGKITMDSVENATAIKSGQARAPPDPDQFRGIKPQVDKDAYLLQEMRSKIGAIQEHARMQPLPPGNLFSDEYMIQHSKRTATEPEPLRYQLAAASPPHVAPSSYELLHAKAAREVLAPPTPADLERYRGKKTNVGVDSYLMVSSRKVAANFGSMVKGREVRNTLTKATEIRL